MTEADIHNEQKKKINDVQWMEKIMGNEKRKFNNENRNIFLKNFFLI